MSYDTLERAMILRYFVHVVVVTAFILPGNWACADDSDLKLLTEQVNNDLLPFQAVRVRLTLVNRGSSNIGPISHLAKHYAIYGVKPPGGSQHLPRGGWPAPPDGFADPSRFDSWCKMNPMVLKPGEKISTTFDLAAEWERDVSASPLFPKAGTYSVHVGYYNNPRVSKTKIDGYANIVVGEPKGDDVTISQKLNTNLQLASIMLSPIIWPNSGDSYSIPEEVMRDVQEIVERYPKSSYADYARFALARSHVKGFTNAANALQANKALALAQLEKINTKSFPYGPEVLVFMKRIVSFPQKPEDVHARLVVEFPDAHERLREDVDQLTPEQWRELNSKSEEKK